MQLCFFQNLFGFIGPVLLVFEFCSRGTLENSLREKEKSKQLFLNKTKLTLVNEIAEGMRHLADSRVRSCCRFLMPDRCIFVEPRF
jgi:hypothetical protein